MSFDRETRNKLARMVGDARRGLVADVTDSLRQLGLQDDGTLVPLSALPGLSDADKAASEVLRDLLTHFAAQDAAASEANRAQAAHARLVREIGFTTLNRLVALRMAEERGLVIESVRNGLAAAGFQLFDRVANGSLGTRAETYRAYLECLYDELAVDLPSLFSRTNPESLVFPSEPVLEQLLGLLNDPSLADLWKEDETIGWVYQYYNDPDERKEMRDASQAPRNSRELAVRNQFFTPRYVVEFLTDNTLGRTWYEMRQGNTRLREECRFLVRRVHPIFLGLGEVAPAPYPPDSPWGDPDEAGEMWICPNAELKSLREVWNYALSVGGYSYAREHLRIECGDLAGERLERYRATGTWEGTFEELRCCLFFEQRRWRHFGLEPEREDLAAILALHRMVCQRWDLEIEVVPFRAAKDPRDLKVLDPACGSGHFLLYAFDLLESIYMEAWADDSIPGSEATGRTLRHDYPDADDLRRAVPVLILRHNLHGVDIDPRAVQIAGLALWLRAQRSFQTMGMVGAARPRLTKGNLVVAEPMPGERDLLEQFVARLDPPLIGGLVKLVFTKMQLAGELGTLLKIEDKLRDAISSAKAVWQRGPKPQQLALMPDEVRRHPEQMPLELDTSGISDESFWERVEERVFVALRDFAAEVGNADATRRRLFAEDAERGFGFIDACRERYDLVLMNPPFGDRILDCTEMLEEAYGDGKWDLYHYFCERAKQLTNESGFVGAIIPRTALYQAHYATLRQSWLVGPLAPMAVAELDLGVLDSATVRPIIIAFSKSSAERQVFYSNLRHVESPESGLLVAIGHFSEGRLSPGSTFHTLSRFQDMPGLRFSLWASEGLLRAFHTDPTLEPGFGKVTEGLTNEDDGRFLRCWWEVPADSGSRWQPFGKFDTRSTFVPDLSMVIDWSEAGYRNLGRVGNQRANERLYFQPGIALPRSCEVGMAATALPPGVVFSGVSRYVIQRTTDNIGLLAYLNTRVAEGLHLVLTPDRDRITGTLRKLPVTVRSSVLTELDCLAREIWNLKVSWLRTHDETFRFFAGIGGGVGPGSVQDYGDLRSRIDQLETEIESVVRREGSLTPLDLATLDSEVRERTGERDLVFSNAWVSSELGLTKAFVSVLLGYAFGRWDIRFATGSNAIPECPTPSTPFTPQPPAFLRQHPTCANEDTWAWDSTEQRSYPLHIAENGILADDPGHSNDLEESIRDVLRVLYGSQWNAVESQTCETLGCENLREYFAASTGFFFDHLKRYSKSKRQAPIYWPLATRTGSYTLWFCYDRLNSDTLFTAVNKHVDPKIETTQKLFEEAEGKIVQATGSAAKELRANIDSIRALLLELRDLRQELLRIAALPYRPNLNDGVIVNAAPFHKLVRSQKWAKDTREVWQKLERGDYDWAHLAYTIWPERVREKCRSDRSLAIAHDLEHLYSGPPPGGARKARGRTQVAMDENDDEE